MFVIYFYDITPRNRKDLGKIKRRFYYHLKAMLHQKNFWKTESVLIADPTYETILDQFFRSFKDDLTVFKVRTKLIEEL